MHQLCSETSTISQSATVCRHFLRPAVSLGVSASRSSVNVQVYRPKGEDYSASVNSLLPALCYGEKPSGGRTCSSPTLSSQPRLLAPPTRPLCQMGYVMSRYRQQYCATVLLALLTVLMGQLRDPDPLHRHLPAPLLRFPPPCRHRISHRAVLQSNHHRLRFQSPRRRA